MMAKTKIIPVMLTSNLLSKKIDFMTVAALAEGFCVDYKQSDQRILMLFQNTSASAQHTITVKKGNALQGISDSEAFVIPAGQIAAMSVESGRFAFVSGADIGTVNVVVSNAEVKMAAVVLP